MATTLAENIMRKHGLSDWTFEIDRAKMRCGCCHYDTRKITLSKHYIYAPHVPFVAIHRTILHEVAHALAGYEANHGPEWIAKCNEIGYLDPSVYAEVAMHVPAAWEIECSCPNSLLWRYRLRRKYKNACCPKCHTKYSVTRLVV